MSDPSFVDKHSLTARVNY